MGQHGFCCFVVEFLFFIKPNSLTTTGTVLVFKCHIFLFSSPGFCIICLVFKNFRRDVFTTWCTYVNQCANVLVSVFDNVRAICLYCSICVDSPEYGNICSFTMQIQYGVHISLQLFLFRRDDRSISAGFSPILSWRFLYSIGVSIKHAEISWSKVSVYSVHNLHFGPILLCKILAWDLRSRPGQ